MNQKYADQQRTIEFILTGPAKYEETRRRILYELFGKLNKFEEEEAILPAVVPILPKMGHYYNYDLSYHRSSSSSAMNRSSIAANRGPFKKNIVPLQPASQPSPIYWRTKSREELKKEIMTDKEATKSRISYIKRRRDKRKDETKKEEKEIYKTDDREEGEIVNCDD